jgi:hypothetical protein
VLRSIGNDILKFESEGGRGEHAISIKPFLIKAHTAGDSLNMAVGEEEV